MNLCGINVGFISRLKKGATAFAKGESIYTTESLITFLGIICKA